MVVAGCDGRNSNVAKIAKLDEIKTNYNQTAITFTANAKLEDNHTAIQIFSDKGILQLCLVRLKKWTYAYNCMVGR